VRRVVRFRSGHTTARWWLLVVHSHSPDPNARSMAMFAFEEWERLWESWKRRGVGTNRSLWDLIAGVFECHQNITHHVHMTPVVSGTRTFHFPIFKEAVGRRAKHPSAAAGAILTGIPVDSERLPQTTKWGNVICKT